MSLIPSFRAAFIVFSASSVLSVSPCWLARCHASQTEYSLFGGTGASFLRVAPSARGAAMGDAFGAYAEDPFAIGWNPAMGNLIAWPEGALAHDEWRNGFRAESATFGMPSFGGFTSAAVQALLVSEIVPYDAQGEVSGPTFGTRHLAVSVSHARRLPWAPVRSLLGGASLRLVSQSLGGSGTLGAVVDAGVLWRIRPGGEHAEGTGWRRYLAALDLNAAAALRNVGFASPGKDPAELSLAASLERTLHRRLGPLRANAELVLFRELGVEIRAGGELEFEYRRVFFFPRLGYRFGPPSAGPEPSGPTFGLGVEHRGLRLDYSAVPYEALGVTHRVSLNVAYAKPARTSREEASPSPSPTLAAVPEASPAADLSATPTLEPPAAETPLPTPSAASPTSTPAIAATTAPTATSVPTVTSAPTAEPAAATGAPAETSRSGWAAAVAAQTTPVQTTSPVVSATEAAAPAVGNALDASVEVTVDPSTSAPTQFVLRAKAKKARYIKTWSVVLVDASGATLKRWKGTGVYIPSKQSWTPKSPLSSAAGLTLHVTVEPNTGPKEEWTVPVSP